MRSVGFWKGHVPRIAHGFNSKYDQEWEHIRFVGNVKYAKNSKYIKKNSYVVVLLLLFLLLTRL